MTSTTAPIDLTPLKTYSLRQRQSKVSHDDFAQTWQAGGALGRFLDSLPNLLAARDLCAVITAIVNAHRNRHHVILGMGAHVIKVGLNPIVIDLMKRGVITAVAMNGAGTVHDAEIALTGQTSEDVSAAIDDGRFGMAEETCALLANALRDAKGQSSGLGQAMGQQIVRQNLPLADQSILACGYQLGIPVTVHIAIGTDITHMHPSFDPYAAGGASHHDFRTFAALVAGLEGGVYLNVGSAVILPEIFLKAVTLVRNLGHPLEHITTVNMDFIRHYRPMTNVVHRPTAKGGCGYNLVGHHEIMFPLLAAGILEALSAPVEHPPAKPI